MIAENRKVGVTADGLVVLRSDRRLASVLSDADPHAEWFVTEEGKRFVKTACELDPIYVQFNLARFCWTTKQVKEALLRVRQVVIAGAGYDTRPLWLWQYLNSKIPVFEIDQPHVVQSKKQILRDHGVSFPEWFHQLPMDLADEAVSRSLQALGYQPGLATLLHLEGLIFFLPPGLVRRVLSPYWLGLGRGSMVLFDYWTNSRLALKNGHFKKQTGSPLFGKFPYPDGPTELPAALNSIGYSAVEIVPLDFVAREIYGDELRIETPQAWFLVKAIV